MATLKQRQQRAKAGAKKLSSRASRGPKTRFTIKPKKSVSDV